LRGLDDQPYAFLINVNYRGVRLSIHFSLHESAAKSSKVESAGDEDPLKEDRKMLELRDALERSRREIENNHRRLSSQEVFARELLSRLNQLRAKKSTPAEQLEQETQRALDEARKEIAQLQKTLATQEPEARELELKFAQMQHGRAVSAEQRQVAPMSPSKSAVIDSTFSMDVGETVVIGTSSLKGDKALIALLTAVRRPDSSRGEQK
jgi:predicted RNase H-like nuclease (RuvC/YqgF family)